MMESLAQYILMHARRTLHHGELRVHDKANLRQIRIDRGKTPHHSIDDGQPLAIPRRLIQNIEDWTAALRFVQRVFWIDLHQTWLQGAQCQ